MAYLTATPQLELMPKSMWKIRTDIYSIAKPDYPDIEP